MKTLFKPSNPADFTEEDAIRFFANFSIEREQLAFTPEETRLLLGVMQKKQLDPRTRPFFNYHFAPLAVQAVRSFFGLQAKPTILELGCGSGNSALLFALLGARVIGLDLDPVLIGACAKRQAHYESLFGPLDLRFQAANAFDLDFGKLAPVDGIYSLFAFNTMQPSRELLARLWPALRPGGLFLVSDGNQDSLYNVLLRSRPCLRPAELGAALIALGCDRPSLSFHCMIAPAVARVPWAFARAQWLEAVVRRLGLMQRAGVSYTIEAKKKGSEQMSSR